MSRTHLLDSRRIRFFLVPNPNTSNESRMTNALSNNGSNQPSELQSLSFTNGKTQSIEHTRDTTRVSRWFFWNGYTGLPVAGANARCPIEKFCSVKQNRSQNETLSTSKKWNKNAIKSFKFAHSAGLTVALSLAARYSFTRVCCTCVTIRSHIVSFKGSQKLSLSVSLFIRSNYYFVTVRMTSLVYGWSLHSAVGRSFLNSTLTPSWSCSALSLSKRNLLYRGFHFFFSLANYLSSNFFFLFCYKTSKLHTVKAERERACTIILHYGSSSKSK